MTEEEAIAFRERTSTGEFYALILASILRNQGVILQGIRELVPHLEHAADNHLDNLERMLLLLEAKRK